MLDSLFYHLMKEMCKDLKMKKMWLWLFFHSFCCFVKKKDTEAAKRTTGKIIAIWLFSADIARSSSGSLSLRSVHINMSRLSCSSPSSRPERERESMERSRIRDERMKKYEAAYGKRKERCYLDKVRLD